MAEGYAPGKVILVGEHFVVHGSPAIALPIKQRGITVSVEPGAGRPWSMPSETEGFVRGLFEAMGVDAESLCVSLESRLPVGAGLGGSAAIAVALIKALEPRLAMRPEEVRTKAHALERLAHGNPSGVDDTVAAYGCPVFFIKGSAPQVMPELSPPALWIGLTKERTSTMDAVAHVSRLAASNPSWFAGLLAEATRLTEGALDALKREAWAELGEILTRNHALLKSVEVSTEALDRLVDAALDAGAYGAKLTGGGLGGAAIAIAPDGLDLHGIWMRAGATEVIGP